MKKGEQDAHKHKASTTGSDQVYFWSRLTNVDSPKKPEDYSRSGLDIVV